MMHTSLNHAHCQAGTEVLSMCWTSHRMQEESRIIRYRPDVGSDTYLLHTRQPPMPQLRDVRPSFSPSKSHWGSLR